MRSHAGGDSAGGGTVKAWVSSSGCMDLVQRARAVDVVLHRMQKALVTGELGEGHLRLVVEIAVVLELTQERLQAPVLREMGHAQEEVPCVLVLRDRLERFDVLQPEPVHEGATGPGSPWLRGTQTRCLMGSLDAPRPRPAPRAAPRRRRGCAGRRRRPSRRSPSGA